MTPNSPGAMTEEQILWLANFHQNHCVEDSEFDEMMADPDWTALQALYEQNDSEHS